jgi:hypothetical protein
VKDAVTDADIAFRQGDLERMSSAELRTHLLTLANQLPSEVRQRDVIRSLILNHLLLQRQIDRMSRRHAFQRWLVAALALAALMSAIVDIAVTVTRDPMRIEVAEPRVMQGGQ